MPVTCPCTYCGKESTSQCSGCREVFYCGTKCQKNHWLEAHKKECGKPRDLKLAKYYNELMEFFVQNSDYDKALEYNKKALEIQEDVLEGDHPDMIASYMNLAHVYLFKKLYEPCLVYNLKALAMSKYFHGENDIMTAECYNNLGMLHGSKKEHVKADEFIQKAVDIIERNEKSSRSIDGAFFAARYKNLASAYFLNRNKEQAIKYGKKSLMLYEKHLGKDHERTALARELCITMKY